MTDELIVTAKPHGYYDAVGIKGPFTVDGITYDERYADNYVCPMIQVFRDGENGREHRWNPEPMTDAEMADWLTYGLIRGSYHG